MKIYKRGFTLTEILLTIAIVGIVGALTIPKLVSTTGDRVNGIAVGRGVELVETGMRNIFEAAQSHGVESNTLAALTLADVYGSSANLGAGVNLGAFIASGDNLFGYAGKFTGTQRVNGDYLANAVEYDGDSLEIRNSSVYRFLKTDIYIIVGNIGQILPAQANDKDLIIARIYIDGNGPKAPNVLGSDIFLFGLSNSGKMVPAGYSAYNNNIFGDDVDSFRDDCTGDISEKDGRACAGRLVHDGWHINY